MKRHQRGVSLIEFMIAFVLTGILVALAIPSFRDWIQNSQVRTAAEAIKDGLQLARAEAVRRNNPVRWRLPSDTQPGWVVEVFDRTASTWTQIQQRSAEEGSGSNILVTAAPQSSVAFLGTGVVTPPPGQTITFDVTHPNGGDCITSAGSGNVRCLRVTVSASGQVRMCDPAQAAGNAAAC